MDKMLVSLEVLVETPDQLMHTTEIISRAAVGLALDERPVMMSVCKHEDDEFIITQMEHCQTCVNETYTDETLFKVANSLSKFGLSEEQTQDAINDMMNVGILFRERVKAGD